MAAFSPIPLSPLVVPGALEDPSALGGGGGGGMMTTFLALPVLFPFLFPIVAPVVVLAVVVVVVAVVVAVVSAIASRGAGENGKKDNYETTPYYDENSYGNDYQDNNNNTNNNYNDNKPNQDNQYRKRRQAEKNKNIPATSSALPSMSIAQVERLTQVVYAALNSHECVQRLLCEVGSLSRSFSDATRTVTKAVEEYVPEKLKDSFNIFAKAEKCEQFKCGSF
jgi:hypothetical protein